MASNASAGEIVITTESAVRIILPAQPSETEEFAASECLRYLRKILGPEFNSQNTDNKDAYPLLIGRTGTGIPLTKDFDIRPGRTGVDSFRTRITSNNAHLVGGGDRGTLYAVYYFLEQAGCRWFAPGPSGEIVPRKQRLVFREQDETHIPDYSLREIDMAANDLDDMEDIIDWAAKTRLNRIYGMRTYHLKGLPSERRNAWSKRGGYVQWQRLCHNFQWFVPNTKYYDEHPDYFALYNGKRIPMGKEGSPTHSGGNLCTTHPDVLRLTADYAKQWFRSNEQGALIPLNPNDGAVKWCECERCRALGGKNFVPGPTGSMTNRMVNFGNAIARLVGPEFPERQLSILAYSNYIEPPEKKSLEHNLWVTYCYHGCYAHAPGKCAYNIEPFKQFESWANLSDGRIGVWEYFLIGDYKSETDHDAILPLAPRARESIRYFRSKGAQHYFTQCSRKYMGSNSFLFYLIARLAWDTNTNYDQLLNDFCSQMYGTASENIENIYTSLDDSVESSDWHPQLYRDVAIPSAEVFTREFLPLADRELDQAMKKELTPVQIQRILNLKRSIAYTKAKLLKRQDTAATGSKGKQESWPKHVAGSPVLFRNAKMDFVPGKAGKAGRFTSDTPVELSSDFIKGNAGTIELWFQLEDDAATMKQQFLFSVGANDPEWFCLIVGNGSASFLYKNGRKPFTEGDSFYSNIYTEIGNIKKSEWRHLAIVWAYQGRGKSITMMYVDGRLREKRANASIGANLTSPTIYLGNSALPNRTFSGLIDELRISNYPKSPAEILEGYKRVSSGKSLDVEDGTLLQISFEGELVGKSNTVRMLGDERLRDRVDVLLEGF